LKGIPNADLDFRAKKYMWLLYFHYNIFFTQKAVIAKIFYDLWSPRIIMTHSKLSF
jgi:hypothetical protein